MEESGLGVRVVSRPGVVAQQDSFIEHLAQRARLYNLGEPAALCG